MLRVSLILYLVAGLCGSSVRAAPTSTLTLAQAKKLVDKLARRTARLRQLRLRRRIAIGLDDHADLLRKLRARLDESPTATELAADEAVLKRLGLLDERQRYRDVLLKVLGEQVVGRYDVKEQRLYLSRQMPKASRRAALVHEICHALQAQNLRLKRFSRKMPQNSDRRLARMALVEGDCTGLVLEDALRGSGVDLGSAGVMVRAILAKGWFRSSPALKKAPLVVRRTLTFPYEAGLRLVQRIRRRGSWRRVNRYFRRPLETTEQILHAEKLRRRERPISVRARQLPALGSWRAIKIDTFGELLLSVLLERHLDREIAARAAAGWGGDRLVAYAAPNVKGLRPLVIHLTTWDTSADAQEFHYALLRWAKARFGVPLEAATTAAKLQRFQMGATKQALIERHRRHVLLIVGSPAALSVTLRTQIWARWKISGRKVSAPAVE